LIRDDTSRFRKIHVRAGVGATAGIIQREALRFSRLTIDQPTLIVVRSGEKVLTSPDGTWLVRSGEAIAVTKGQRLDVTNRPDAKGSYEANWLVWEPSLLDTFTSSSGPLSGPAYILDHLESDFLAAFNRACEALTEPKRIPNAIARHRMQEILLWLQGHGVKLVGLQSDSFVHRVRSMLLSGLDATWTAGSVARRLHMSEATLRRRLVAEGASLTDLLADVRMSHALALLQSTDYPVGHIASCVGYASASRFAIRFRERFGFAPTTIRGHRRDNFRPEPVALPR
jgi:AraC-like DNA-binding protein